MKYSIVIAFSLLVVGAFASSCRQGYPCCEGCTVVYTDDDGDWGVENRDWCFIDKIKCNKKYTCNKKYRGFECCSHCVVSYTDNEGNWGLENEAYCKTPSNCESITFQSEYPSVSFQILNSSSQIIIFDSETIDIINELSSVLSDDQRRFYSSNWPKTLRYNTFERLHSVEKENIKYANDLTLHSSLYDLHFISGPLRSSGRINPPISDTEINIVIFKGYFDRINPYGNTFNTVDSIIECHKGKYYFIDLGNVNNKNFKELARISGGEYLTNTPLEIKFLKDKITTSRYEYY